jgi:hypothetical protein
VALDIPDGLFSRRTKEIMPTKLRPMTEFDPTKQAFLHDKLNDKVLDWKSEWAEHYRQYAIFESNGNVGWDGLILDGWRPPIKAS